MRNFAAWFEDFKHRVFLIDLLSIHLMCITGCDLPLITLVIAF